MDILSKSAALLSAEVRRTMVQALMLLRNRGLIPGLPLLKLFFQLFRVQDKLLREVVFTQIISDIKNLNRAGVVTAGSKRKVKLHPSETNKAAVNAKLQTFMYSMVHDTSTTAARKSLDVLIELFRRRIWTDARTVNAIAAGCQSDSSKLVVPACRFLCGELDAPDEDEADSEDEAEQQRKAQEYAKAHKPNASDLHLFSKKTRKRYRQAQRHISKMRIRKTSSKDKEKVVFPAVTMLHDPQGLAEHMLKQVRGGKFRFEVRLLMLNAVTRIVGQHKLIILSLYSFLQRYLTAHQRHVTQVMAYLIQGCHENVPPQELVPVLRGIANAFITERCPAEVMQVGINAVNEVVKRAPSVLEEDGMQELVTDLVLYRKDRDKGVVMASRGLLNTVRELYPTLLDTKDRGMGHDAEAAPSAYGALPVVKDVFGATMLAAERIASGKVLANAEDDDSAWRAAAAGDSDSDDWEELDMGGGSDEEEEAAPEPMWARRQRLRAERQAAAAGAGGDDESDEEGSDDDAELEGDEEEDGDDSDAVSEQDGEEGDSDDEEGEDLSPEAQEKRKQRLASDVAALKAGVPVASTRFLTPADFARMKELQSAAQSKLRRGKKRPRSGEEEGVDIEAVVATALKAQEANSAAVVGFNPDEIESAGILKRRVQAERALEVERTKTNKWTPGQRRGGSTNEEKLRTKNFMMLRKSRAVQVKTKKSLKHQQKNVRKHLHRMANLISHDKRKRRRS